MTYDDAQIIQDAETIVGIVKILTNSPRHGAATLMYALSLVLCERMSKEAKFSELSELSKLALESTLKQVHQAFIIAG